MSGLLNVGEMGALGLHALVELAQLRERDPEARLTVQELSARLHASSHTLQKVARRLVMLGLVEGTRGAGGGLKLTAEPETVTLLQVVEGVEGRVCSNGCMFAKRVCDTGAQCLFHGVTGTLERMVQDYFRKTTLRDLMPAPRKSKPDKSGGKKG